MTGRDVRDLGKPGEVSIALIQAPSHQAINQCPSSSLPVSMATA